MMPTPRPELSPHLQDHSLLPMPRPSDECRTKSAATQSQKIALRRELHRRGRRFFIDRAPLAGLRHLAEVVFPIQRLAVYVDGCFSPCCPIHATWPTNNAEWWKTKLAANVPPPPTRPRHPRCRRLDVLRVWEHEQLSSAADRLEAALRTPASSKRPCRPRTYFSSGRYSLAWSSWVSARPPDPRRSAHAAAPGTPDSPCEPSLRRILG
jgi:DNA mismatch endonuclease (patch repair protein)